MQCADENFFPWIDICAIQINKLLLLLLLWRIMTDIKKDKNCLTQQLTFQMVVFKITIFVVPLNLSSRCSLQRESILA